MNTVRKSVIVAHSCEEMYHLVEECERYPEFLPWCPKVEVTRTPEATHAKLHIDYHGLKSHIVTLNRKEPPHRLTLEFVDGPFRRFHGEWRFTPLGDAGCRVELAVDYAFAGAAVEKILGPVFGYLTETMVDRFVERAQHPERRIRRK